MLMVGSHEPVEPGSSTPLTERCLEGNVKSVIVGFTGVLQARVWNHQRIYECSMDKSAVRGSN